VATSTVTESSTFLTRSPTYYPTRVHSPTRIYSPIKSNSKSSYQESDYSMAEDTNGREPPKKKVKLEDIDNRTDRTSILTSLAAPISPPHCRRPEVVIEEQNLVELVRNEGLDKVQSLNAPNVLPSPFQLTSIQDLPATSNIDTVTLKDLLGHPLISECWEFNYLHDLDFLIDAFDPDVQELVKVHVIHGFWKHEDGKYLQVILSFLSTNSKTAHLNLHLLHL
jgi:tyrosyl-DNA phosphodiesterase-1